MHVCLLEISGFRGVKQASICLEPHVILLGPNNVGKTAVVDALALLLGRRGLVRDLGDHDFFGSSPRGDTRILLTATVTGFEPDDEQAHPEWFNMHDAGVAAWWRPDKGNVAFGERPTGSRLAIQIGFAARFDEELFEVETLRYFVDGEGDPFEDTTLRRVRARHLLDLGLFLLPSHRTWDRVLSFSSDLFKRTLKSESAVPGSALTKMRDSLRKPKVKLEEEPGLTEIVQRVEAELARYVGDHEARFVFRPTTGDIEGVLRAVMPHLRGKGQAHVPLGRHGSGVISLQTILLLLEIGRARSDDNKNFILAAEEPELHLHPGHHRRLVARMRGVSDQSLTTTHSPQVAAYYRPTEVLVLQNKKGKLRATPMLPSGAHVPEKNALMRLFTLYRAEVCEALMHSTVVVPEGTTEFRWLRALHLACVTAEGWTDMSPGEATAHALGVLPTQDANVVATYEQFAPLASDLLPLIDGDKSGKDYLRNLRKLKPAPARVARLGDGADLETVIASILLPASEQEDRWEGIEAALDGIEARDGNALRRKLTTFKGHWSRHDELVAMISDWPEAASRARSFLDDLVALGTGHTDKLPAWDKDDASTVRTDVWVWRVPEAVSGS